MPKYKPSLGQVEFTTVFPAEFRTYLEKEVKNFYEWNRAYCLKVGRVYIFRKLWKITFMERKVIVISREPKVWLGKGLSISMGNAEIKISGKAIRTEG